MAKEGETYPCVWNPKVVCPIRTIWKLKPESLVEWCKICDKLPLHKKRRKT